MVSVSAELYLQRSIERLRLAIFEQNRPGSVEGLLAHHILRDDPQVSFDWQVYPTQEWITNSFKPINIDHVAALGYFRWASPASSQFNAELVDGLERVMERDPFKGDHLSLARHPSRLLGIILGAIALGQSGGRALNWCRSVLEEVQKSGLTSSDPLVYYLLYRAFERQQPLEALSTSELYGLSFWDWAVRCHVGTGEPSLDQLMTNRRRLLFQAATDLRFDSAPQAAFIWTGVNAALLAALGEVCVQPRHVAAVLRNFESAMKRWRWDVGELKRPVQWPILQEREVQDILWLVLRSYFIDVVDEDTLPKLGHSTYRADFGIPSLKLIIEAKFASAREDFKKIEKEVQEDCIPYLRDLRYNTLIVFIYDDSASVQEHETTRRALLELPGIVDVVIVSRPSQLPAKRAESAAQ